MRPTNLPESIINEIPRESLVDGLIFQADEHPVVIVSGPTNIGKTTLLAQFYTTHSDICIATFVSGASSFGYEYEAIVADLCDQVRHLTGGKGIRQGIDIETPTTNWRLAFSELNKWARAQKRTVYFILDGLDEIPPAEEAAAAAIFKLMPLGLGNFRFLLSGQRALKLVRNNAQVKDYGEFTVTKFTPEETERYLKDVLTGDESKQVYKISRGLPGYCANIRRYIKSQGPFPEGAFPENITKIFEYEWKQAMQDSDLRRLVGFISFDKHAPTVARLAVLLKESPESVANRIASISFLEVRAKVVVFDPESFRAFAVQKVAPLQREITNAIIENFLSDGTSEESMSHLPELLTQAGRYDQVIEYLNDEYVLAALRRKKAARFIQERAALGLRAATKKERTADIIRFGLQGANFDALYLDEHWTARVNAYVAIGEEEKALSISRSFSAPEDRIQALSAVAINQKYKNGRSTDSLLEEIRREHAMLDKEHLGDRAYDIASDLVLVEPRLALSLIQNLSGLELDQKKDAMPAPKVAAAADDADKCAASAMEILRNRITDPAWRSFSRALSAASKGQTSEQVLSEVNSLSSDEEKIYFLRIWLSENRKHASRAAVIRFAIDFSRSSKSVTATPVFFRDVLRAAGGLPETPGYLDEIRALAPLLKRTGPTAEYYRLMLYLSELESRVGKSTAQADFASLARDANSIGDVALRSLVAAEWLLSLTRMKEANIAWVNKQHIQDASNTLDAAVDAVLSNTADHYQCLRRTIATLARFDCQRAQGFVERINTEGRRDQAYADLVYCAVVLRVRAVDIKLVSQSFEAIVGQDVKVRCLLSTLDGLVQGKSKMEIFSVQAIETWCSSLHNPNAAAQALALLFIVLIKHTKKSSEELGWVKERIADRIRLIPDPIDRIDTLYKLIFALTDYDRTTAMAYLDEAELLRQKLLVKTRGIQHCLTLNINVLLRAFSGLIPQKAFRELELKELLSMIEKLPDAEQQVFAYTELAVRFYLGGDLENCRDVVAKSLKPILANIPVELVPEQRRFTVIAAPALYVDNPVSSLSILEGLPLQEREDAIARILKVIVSKLPPDEPEQERTALPTDISHTQVDELLQLVRRVEDDSFITCYLRHVVRHLSSGKAKSTRPEIEQTRATVEKIVSTKLPSSRFKAHNGYRLLGEGHVLALKNAKGPEWEELLSQVRVIPNVSDRCFVIACFAEVMGPKLIAMRKSLLEEALELADKIPVCYDRAERLVYIAEIARDIDGVIFKNAISQVLAVPPNTDVDERSMNTRRRAVDMTYFENETLANTLVAALDDDPSRDVRKMLDKRLEFLALQKKVIDHKTDGMDLRSEETLPSIFWQNLRRLNSNQIIPPSFKHLAPLFAGIEGRTIHEVYPILSYGIESCVRNYARTEEAHGILRRIYKVCADSSKILLQCLIQQPAAGLEEPPQSTSSVLSDHMLIVRKGEKEAACRFIRDRIVCGKADRIYIVDPYFTATEIDLVTLLSEIAPQVPIHVMTSKQCIQQTYTQGTAINAFKEAWRPHARESSDVKVYIVGLSGTGEPPVHDRMILIGDVGIKLGGSWNGVGGNKEMDINVLDPSECLRWRERIESFVVYFHRLHNGTAVEYELFSI